MPAGAFTNASVGAQPVAAAVQRPPSPLARHPPLGQSADLAQDTAHVVPSQNASPPHPAQGACATQPSAWVGSPAEIQLAEAFPANCQGGPAYCVSTAAHTRPLGQSLVFRQGGTQMAGPPTTAPTHTPEAQSPFQPQAAPTGVAPSGTQASTSCDWS
jgi:hypothetical protein